MCFEIDIHNEMITTVKQIHKFITLIVTCVCECTRARAHMFLKSTR